jgi:hypothetical protein
MRTLRGRGHRWVVATGELIGGETRVTASDGDAEQAVTPQGDGPLLDAVAMFGDAARADAFAVIGEGVAEGGGGGRFSHGRE